MKEDIEELYDRFLESDGVSIDTRTIEKGNLFFAISGPNFNANQFASQALEQGATYAIVDDESVVKNNKTILVENGLASLQDLAKFHRSKFNGPVLGITGSNGKTTTKELITKVLSEKFNVHATKGNFNNHIGVPLTLLGLKNEAEIAIIEMGANHVGEIASYCEIARPTHGLITNIGRAHTETFGGIEGVIRGKSELFDFLRKTNGMPFINLDDPVLSNMAKRFSNSVTFPLEALAFTETSPFLKIELGGKESYTNLIGKYNFSNVAAAIAVGQFFEIDDPTILQAIGQYAPDNARSEIIRKGSRTIILDAYNANPDSMKVALESLAEQDGAKLAVLGDMNELEHPDASHLEVLDHAAAIGIGSVLTVGNKIGKVADTAHHFATKEDLEAHLKTLDLSDTTVLLKASRSIKLETILKSI